LIDPSQDRVVVDDVPDLIVYFLKPDVLSGEGAAQECPMRPGGTNLRNPRDLRCCSQTPYPYDAYQHRAGWYWSEERVFEELDRIMREAFQNVLRSSLHHEVPMRVAAFIVGIQSVTRTAELRGLYA
jgi:hypothetical protein